MNFDQRNAHTDDSARLGHLLAVPTTPNEPAFKAFDQRQPGWIKVELVPSA